MNYNGGPSEFRRMSYHAMKYWLQIADAHVEAEKAEIEKAKLKQNWRK